MTGKLHPQVFINTPRLLLRGARMSDAEDLFECFSDAEAMRYWDTLPHETVERTSTWVEKMVRGRQNGVLEFVICLKSEDEDDQNEDVHNLELKVIGKVGVWHGDEIGFILNRRHWRKGFAVEAIRPVLDLAFGLEPHETTSISTVDVPTSEEKAASDAAENSSRKDVVADVDPRNTASLGILEKLGFEVYEMQEKTMQVGDEWVDSAYLSLKRETWIARRKTLGGVVQVSPKSAA